MREKTRFPRFDAELNTDCCDAHNNAELTLTMRIGFRRIDPAGGAAEGTFHDAGGAGTPARRIIRWTPDAWNRWKQNFVRSAQAFWHGKFWLLNDAGTHDYKLKSGLVLYPNVWCRFRLQGFDAPAADLHHTIDVVRLHPTEDFFRSHSTLYDSKDTWSKVKGRLADGTPVMQRAHVHEIGHLLGMDHVDVGKAHCPVGSDTGADPCYGVADNDLLSVMGSGMQLRPEQAFPWRESLRQLTALAAGRVKGPLKDAGSPLVDINFAKMFLPIMMLGGAWPSATRRHYPRTMAELAAGKAITSWPTRH